MYYYLDFEAGELPPGQDPAYNDKSFEKLIGTKVREFIYIIDHYLSVIQL